MAKPLEALPTACLILDDTKMIWDVIGIHGRLPGTGVRYRAHPKTATSVDLARPQMLEPSGPAMVSTLREAEEFADAGVTDIIYGVPIAPLKLGQVLALRLRGIDLAVTLDSVKQAEAGGGDLNGGAAARGADRDRLRRPSARCQAGRHRPS
jgi:D-serine deaminase-like pyridoxal phosphate-dependent protein